RDRTAAANNLPERFTTPWERIRKSLIFKHLLFVVAGSGAHYREIETGVNTYLKLFNPKVRKPRGRPIPPL
ncbi:hypothetical protein OE420_14965, partial [Pseudomonas aeruginosa]|nr:hypothetical protein [Pseudomonas aeruginosa]MCU8983327.1 hypothetical protein [Pseudomonas aeruginosa]MCU8989586.1 hypothetical protein [Pseudomonas aeruginosa]MCU8995280.1 hypothetical protein [Pseudomonas aeruginosa]MCU9002534.1 hypothetical protein [Pseudomonas aeruginosa]